MRGVRGLLTGSSGRAEHSWIYSAALALGPATIKKMLIRENELRLCVDTQLRFEAVREQPDGWLQVVEELQMQVAREFGLLDAVGLLALRGAEQLLPGDKEVISISLYRKFNRCQDGRLSVGSPAPDAPLHPMHALQDTARLSSLVHGARPLILFAGSFS